MKKILYIATCILLMNICGFAQESSIAKGQFQLNAGLGVSGWGVPFYLSADYGIHPDITIGAELSFRSYKQASIVGLLANAQYHFNRLLNIPSNWALYAGASLGFYSWGGTFDTNRYGTGVGWGIDIGGRYYFNTHFGINLELGIANAALSKVGVSYRF